MKFSYSYNENLADSIYNGQHFQLGLFTSVVGNRAFFRFVMNRAKLWCLYPGIFGFERHTIAGIPFELQLFGCVSH